MNKKYLPFIALLATALFFYWVKNNQRGPKDKKYDPVEITGTGDVPFNRNATRIIYSKHARCRMDCRHIDESEVKEILASGRLNTAKTGESSKGKSYPLEGITHDGQKVRIVFAPKEEGELVVVTVIDLGTDFECDCK